MEDKIKDGMKISELFALLLKRKLIMLITTVLTAVCIVLLIVLLYNPAKTRYEANFDLTFTGAVKNTYPNGEVFNYKDIVSLDNLLEVKGSDEKYAKIDVAKLYRQNKIQISKTVVEGQPDEYHMVFLSTGISNSDIMADFVYDILALTVQRIEASADSMKILSDLEKFNEYTIYSNGVRYLIEQSNKIISNYELLIESFGPNYVVNGRSLRSRLNSATALIQGLYLNSLLSESENNRLVKNQEALDQYEVSAGDKVSELLRRKQQNDLMISQYNAISGNGSIFFTEQMEAIVRDNSEIILEVQSLLRNFDPTQNIYTFEDSDLLDATIASEDFIAKVNSAYSQLASITKDLDESTEKVCKNSIVLNYGSNSIVVKQGDINFVIAAIAGIALGLVFGSILVLCIELPKRKKEEQINA